MCTKWFLGTGGGDGRSTMFESWDDAKLDKYKIRDETYDHTDVAARPSILVNNYHSHRQPYLTMIFLWDEMVNFLLSSRYDPLNAGTGEAGMPKVGDNECDSIVDDMSRRTVSPIHRRGKRGKNTKKEGGMKETMIEIVNLIKNSTTAKEPSQTPSSVSTIKSGCSMILDKLNGTHDRYMAHLQCLKDNDLLTAER